MATPCSPTMHSPTSTHSGSEFEHLSSVASSQSFNLLSHPHSEAESSAEDNDDDQIVWSVSSQASLGRSLRVFQEDDDGDFVVVRTAGEIQPHVPATSATPKPVEQTVIDSLSRLRVEDQTPRKLWSEEVDEDVAKKTKGGRKQKRASRPPNPPLQKTPATQAKNNSANQASERKAKMTKSPKKITTANQDGSVPLSPAAKWAKRYNERRNKVAEIYPSPATTPTPPTPPAVTTNQKETLKAKKKRAKGATAQAAVDHGKAVRAFSGLGQRPVVDDMSEAGESTANGQKEMELLSTAYNEAVAFMNAFIQNPAYYTSKASRLTFLQALILELGLCDEFALPNSLTGARTLLKTHAFLSVRDYLAVRAQGIEALRGVMHGSKRALVSDLRRPKKSSGPRSRAPLGWVKETGLTVLLVRCY